MNRKILWIISLMFSLIFSQAVLADTGCREGLKDMVASLNLSSAQKEKIKPILEQLKSTMKTNGMQMDDLKTQINQQLYSDNMDQTSVDSLIDKKTALIGNMIKAKVTATHQLLTVLNPQQKTALQNRMKKAEEAMTAKFKHCHEQD